MNKKGFTTIELILTMAIVITIMATITSVTYVYRDKSVEEQTITDIMNYKNTVTKVIYDDILENGNEVIKLENDDNKYILTRKDNSTITLEIIDRNVQRNGTIIHEVGIIYDGIEYLVPGSLGSLVTFDGVSTYPSDLEEESNYYGLDIVFSHKNIKEPIKLHFIISK